MAATRFPSGASVRPCAWLWLLAVACLLAAGPAEAKRAKKAAPDAKGAAMAETWLAANDADLDRAVIEIGRAHV